MTKLVTTSHLGKYEGSSLGESVDTPRAIALTPDGGTIAYMVRYSSATVAPQKRTIGPTPLESNNLVKGSSHE